MEELEINPQGEAPQQAGAATGPDPGTLPAAMGDLLPLDDQSPGPAPTEDAVPMAVLEAVAFEGEAPQQPAAATGPDPEARPAALVDLLPLDDQSPAPAPMEEAQPMAVLEAVAFEGDAPQQPDAAAGPDPEAPPAALVDLLPLDDQSPGPAPMEEAQPMAVLEAVAFEGEAPQQPAAATGPDPEAPPAALVDLLPLDDQSPAPAPMEEAQPMAVLEAVAFEGEAPQQPETATGPDPEAPPVAMEDLLPLDDQSPAPAPMEDAQLMAVLEAVVYVAEEPLTLAQIAAAIEQPPERVDAVLRQLIAELEKPEHGIAIREVAGGFKMATKAEHHEAVRNFVKSLKPPMKLSLPALETLSVIAYKQPVTAPEIMEIRGVQGAGVLKTLLDRKLIAVAGRKNVIGKPILYKTTRDFLIQFGLNDVSELPSLKEFEEIRRMSFADSEPAAGQALPPDGPSPEPDQPAGGSASPTEEK